MNKNKTAKQNIKYCLFNSSSLLWLLWPITKVDFGQSFSGVDDGDLFADACGDRLSHLPQHSSYFGQTPTLTLLFIGAGIITSLPLLWFNNAAQRLRLSTLGFFQYIPPSLHLGLGVGIYHELFTQAYLVTFGLIWAALALYSTTSTQSKLTGNLPTPFKLHSKPQMSIQVMVITHYKRILPINILLDIRPPFFKPKRSQ